MTIVQAWFKNIENVGRRLTVKSHDPITTDAAQSIDFQKCQSAPEHVKAFIALGLIESITLEENLVGKVSTQWNALRRGWKPVGVHNTRGPVSTGLL